MNVVQTADIDKYCGIMEEIKRRMSVIEFFLSGKGHALYIPPTVESVCLQVRKILELIAFGSLAANKDLYSATYTQFASHWHAGRLLRDLAKVNPDFYPKPVIEVDAADPRIRKKLENRQPDYLSKDDFVTAYDECGAVMHASNPYGTPIDYAEYQRKTLSWPQRIMNLLNCHQVQLVNDAGFWLIHMKEERDDKVHYYRFQPPTPEQRARIYEK